MPVEEAIYVMVIADKTGWTENYIRHQLPLSRGWAYFHAARLMEGERCRWPGRESRLAGHVDNLRNWIRKVTKRHPTHR